MRQEGKWTLGENHSQNTKGKLGYNTLKSSLTHQSIISTAFLIVILSEKHILNFTGIEAGMSELL